MNLVLAGILGYVALQLLVGLLVSRNIKSETDYLLAGRRLGPLLATFSIFATWFGAESCIGAAGEVYAGGLWGGSADPFGYALCIFLMAALVAALVWNRGLVTLADLFRERFSGGVERFAAIVMIPTSVLWAGAQIRAFGQVLASSSDALGVDEAIAIATGVVLLYTIAGGLLADAYTDLLQGALLMLGLVALCFVVGAETGGVGASIALVEPERRALREPGASWAATINAWSIPILGSVTAQELVARVSASRSASVARRAAWAGGALYLCFGLIPVWFGLVGPSLEPGLADGEQLLPALAERHFNTFFRVVFLGVLVSAILSTVDSALLVAGSLLSHNLVLPLVPGMDERAKLRAARIAVLVFGLVAYGLARSTEGVHELVQEASGFGSQGILVLLCMGLFTRTGGARAAHAAIAAGLGAWVLAHYVIEHPLDYLLALAASLAAYFAGAALESARRASPRAR